MSPTNSKTENNNDRAFLDAMLASDKTGDSGDLTSASMNEALSKLQSNLAEENRPLARLKSLATPYRIVMSLILMAVLMLIVVFVTRRPDMADYPAARMVLSVTFMAGLMIVGQWVVLRSMHMQPIPQGWRLVLFTAAALAPFVLAVLPEPPGEHPVATLMQEKGLLLGALPCFIFGTVIGLPVFIVSWILDRGAFNSSNRVLLAGFVATLSGNLALLLHCPNNHNEHLLMGHAAVILPFLLAYAVLKVFKK